MEIKRKGTTTTVRYSLTTLLIQTATAMIGYTIHHSVFWSIIDFLLVPLVWIKWLIYNEVSLSIIRETFRFLFE